MTRHSLLVAAVLAAAVSTACETMETPAGGITGVAARASAPITLSMGVLIPSRLTPDQALDRARQRVALAGFDFDVSSSVAGGVSPVAFALANRPSDPQLCAGTTEVIAVSANETPRMTVLRLSCVTETLASPASAGDGCMHVDTPGCPAGGDRLVATLARDSIASL
jgi:hypothetical protein